VNDVQKTTTTGGAVMPFNDTRVNLIVLRWVFWLIKYRTIINLNEFKKFVFQICLTWNEKRDSETEFLV
jgi:hypothetical protein